MKQIAEAIEVLHGIVNERLIQGPLYAELRGTIRILEDALKIQAATVMPVQKESGPRLDAFLRHYLEVMCTKVGSTAAVSAMCMSIGEALSMPEDLFKDGKSKT